MNMASWKKFSKAKYHELQRVIGQPMNVIPYLLRMKAVKKLEPVCARLKRMLPRMKIYCRCAPVSQFKIQKLLIRIF